MEVLKTAMSEVPVLKVTGDLDHLTAPALEEAIEDALSAGHMRLLVDLAAHTSIVAASQSSFTPSARWGARDGSGSWLPAEMYPVCLRSLG